MPHNVTVMLHVARILLGYGRNLIDTIRHRAAAPSFDAIAATFGTANLATILNHLNRGIMRAVALERFLLARAATGRDLYSVEPRTRAPWTPPAPADPQAGQPAAREAAPRPPHRTGRNAAEFYMPTLEELERQVRRRPLGRTFVDICLDLGVVCGFCTPTFWSDLFEILYYYRGSVAAVMQREADRRKAYLREQDRKRGCNWDWLRLSRDALHKILGFFIGEPPVDPFAQAAAVATGPP